MKYHTRVKKVVSSWCPRVFIEDIYRAANCYPAALFCCCHLRFSGVADPLGTSRSRSIRASRPPKQTVWNRILISGICSRNCRRRQRVRSSKPYQKLMSNTVVTFELAEQRLVLLLGWGLLYRESRILCKVLTQFASYFPGKPHSRARRGSRLVRIDRLRQDIRPHV